MDYSRDEEGMPRKERELTLSMGAILGIFFGLVLLCGLFFGLGYNVRGRQIASVTATEQNTESSTNPQFSSFKPAAGSPAGSKPVVVVAPDASTAGQTTVGTNQASSSPANAHAATPANTADPGATATPQSAAPITRLSPPPNGHSGVVTATVANPSQLGGGPTSAPPGTGSFVVQVAAVSHKEDADLLLSALKGRGYAVSAHTESQDKLVHIQIGPFSNRKDAEAMRQRLQGDGYNAIIK